MVVADAVAAAVEMTGRTGVAAAGTKELERDASCIGAGSGKTRLLLPPLSVRLAAGVDGGEYSARLLLFGEECSGREFVSGEVVWLRL